jgi:hypothetical protein
LKCPNPYLALESVAGPKEVWWLNAFTSEADRARVGRAYEQNVEVAAALRDVAQRKQGLVHDPENFFATYRRDLSVGCAWRIEGARFFVLDPGGASGAPPGAPPRVFRGAGMNPAPLILRGRFAAPGGVNPAPPRGRDDVPTRAGANGQAGGCVFEAPHAKRFVIAPAATRGDAKGRAAAAAPHAKIWAIRPAWSLPAAAWIAADPDFWRTSPAARSKGGER